MEYKTFSDRFFDLMNEKYPDLTAEIIKELDSIYGTDGENTILKVSGESYRCSCGCNVFQKTIKDPGIYVCNSCHSPHYSDKSVTVWPNDIKTI